MKKKEGRSITLLLALMFVFMNLFVMPSWATLGDVAIDEANFPDANFRTYVSTNFDTDNNGVLSQSERDTVTRIDVTNSEITTLKGMKHFDKLEELHCSSNELTALDLSQCTKLKSIHCDNNQLAALDVSNNPELVDIYCSENKLTAMDVSNNPELVNLYCYKNQLTALDLSQCTKLMHLDCQYNQLTTLHLSNSLELVYVGCGNNRLTNLDPIKNEGPVVEGKNQNYDIEVGKSTRRLNLKSLPGNFDPSMASGWAGASVSGNTLKLDSTKPEQVTYTYRVNDNNSLSVTLNVTYRDEVKITFNANGGSGTMEDVTVFKDSTYKLPACTFTAPTGKAFKSWEVGGVEKAVGDSIKVNADTTVKAIWKEKPVTPIEKVTVSFDNNGHGTAPAAQTINKGQKATKPSGLTEDGYTFGGWFTEAACINEYDFNTPVNANLTLYAKWTPSNATGTTSTVEKFMITVDPNGGNWNGSTAVKIYEIEKGQYITLPVAPTKEGYTFVYWKGSKYQPGDKYLVEGEHTFTAVWEKNGVSDKMSPNTGDYGMMYVYALELLMAASGMLILNARRNKNNLK